MSAKLSAQSEVCIIRTKDFNPQKEPEELATCYAKYLPPTPSRTRLPDHPPFISEKVHARKREGGWNMSNLCDDPAPRQTWKRAESVVQKMHSEGTKQCTQADEHIKLGQFEQALRCFRAARTMFVRSLDRKQVKLLQRPRVALARRAVAVVAGMVEQANELIDQDEYEECKELASTSHRILCWVAYESKGAPKLAARARADTVQVGLLWVNCAFALANQALEQAHGHLLVGTHMHKMMAGCIGRAAEQYKTLLMVPSLPMHEETEQRLRNMGQMESTLSIQSELVMEEVDALLNQCEELLEQGITSSQFTLLPEAKTLLAALPSESEGLEDMRNRWGEMQRNFARAEVAKMISSAGWLLKRHDFEDCYNSCNQARVSLAEVQEMGVLLPGEAEMDSELDQVIESLMMQACTYERIPDYRSLCGQAMAFVDQARSAWAMSESEVAKDCAERGLERLNELATEFGNVVHHLGNQADIQVATDVCIAILEGGDPNDVENAAEQQEEDDAAAMEAQGNTSDFCEDSDGYQDHPQPPQRTQSQ